MKYYQNEQYLSLALVPGHLGSNPSGTLSACCGSRQILNTMPVGIECVLSTAPLEESSGTVAQEHVGSKRYGVYQHSIELDKDVYFVARLATMVAPEEPAVSIAGDYRYFLDDQGYELKSPELLNAPVKFKRVPARADILHCYWSNLEGGFRATFYNPLTMRRDPANPHHEEVRHDVGEYLTGKTHLWIFRDAPAHSSFHSNRQKEHFMKHLAEPLGWQTLWESPRFCNRNQNSNTATLSAILMKDKA